MLRATELRLGNYIMDEFHKNRDARVMRLNTGSEYPITYSYNKAFEASPLMAAGLLGIRLTDEWFENFGFTFKGEELGARFYEKQVGIDFICFSRHGHWNINSGKSRWYMDRNFKSPTFVHELQNIYYSLTGFELEIDSLKALAKKENEKANKH